MIRRTILIRTCGLGSLIKIMLFLVPGMFPLKIPRRCLFMMRRRMVRVTRLVKRLVMSGRSPLIRVVLIFIRLFTLVKRCLPRVRNPVSGVSGTRGVIQSGIRRNMSCIKVRSGLRVSLMSLIVVNWFRLFKIPIRWVPSGPTVVIIVIVRRFLPAVIKLLVTPRRRRVILCSSFIVTIGRVRLKRVIIRNRPIVTFVTPVAVIRVIQVVNGWMIGFLIIVFLFLTLFRYCRVRPRRSQIRKKFKRSRWASKLTNSGSARSSGQLVDRSFRAL